MTLWKRNRSVYGRRHGRLRLEALEDRTLFNVNLLSAFKGLNTNDAGGIIEPPDPIAAAGPSVVIEEVNSNIAYYDKASGKQLFNEGLDVFFAPADQIQFFYSDVNVNYDDQVGRFFVSTMDINFDPTSPTGLASYFDFAISNDSNPMHGFQYYQINTTETSNRTGQVLFTDFPRLGWNADAYVIAFNMFDFDTMSLQYNVQLLTIDKTKLLDPVHPTLSYHQADRPLPNSTLVPAVMHGSAPGDPMWLVEEKGLEQDGSYTFLRVVKMTNVLSAAPTFTDYYVPMNAYTITPFPKDTAGTISFELDTRILNVDWRNNQMVLAQNVGIESDMDTHARWYEISTAGAAPSMVQQGTLNPGPGIDTYMPSVALAPDGTIGMSYMQSADGVQDMSMYVTGRAPSDTLGTMQAGVKVSPNPLPGQLYNYGGSRVGDFSGITVDPADPTSFWAVNEYAIQADPLLLNFPNWGTYIGHFNVDSLPGVPQAVLPADGGGPSSPKPRTTVTLPKDDNLGRSRGNCLLPHPPVGPHRGNGGGITGNGPSGGPSPRLVGTGASFPGLNTNDAGGIIEPPDPIAAAGPTVVVEEVNSNIAYYDKATGKRLFEQGLDAFFAPVDSIDFLLSDVNVNYDDQVGRFFVSTMDINFDPTSPTGLASYFDFAISNDSNPMHGFQYYQINTTETSNRTGQVLFTDFPRLGWNADAYVIAFNMFDFDTMSLQYNVQLLTIDKAKLLDPVHPTLSYHQVDRPLPNSTMVPAVMHGSVSGDPMWFVEEKGLEQDGSYAFLRVVKMTNVLSATPTFTDYYVPMEAYTITPFPKDTAGTISFELDTRILNVDWRNNQMVLAQNAGIISDMDTHARWYEISTAGAAPSMVQQGTLNPGPGIDTYMPSVALAPDGTIGMSYMQSADGVQDMSMYVTGRAPSDTLGTMQAGVKVSPNPLPGQLHNYGGSRVGDFSGITVDPSNPTTFWAVNEYAIQADPLLLNFPNWGTWIASFHVIPLTNASGGFTISATEGSDSGSQTVATFTDPSDPTATPSDFKATIDWGDGSTSSGTITQPGGVGTKFVVSGHHTYVEEGAFTITVTITDKSGNTASATSIGSVADAGLTVTGGFTVTATEASVSGSQTVATFTDANLAAPVNDFTAMIDWGDGSTSAGTITQPGGAGTAFVVSGSHTYAEEGASYSIKVSITDMGGSTASATSSATVADAALSATGSFTVTATEGSASGSQTLATFTDANPTAAMNDFTATIDWGDGTTGTGTITQPGGAGTAFVVSGSQTYAEEGSFAIKVSITDTGGSTASASSSASVADAALTATGGFTVTATEGNTTGAQTVAAFTDANPAAPLADFAVTIDWGDGTALTTGTITQSGGAGTAFVVQGSHIYAEEGSFAIKVSITDMGGSTASASSTASVADAVLTATGGFTVTATEASATSSQTVATFTDANPTAPLADFTATIDWGDGSASTTGTVTQPGGVGPAFVVQGSHTYSEEGSFAIKVAITDVGGSTTSASSTASVADAALTATGGFTVTATEASATGSQTVATFTDANPTAPLADFTAIIDWGDGTTPTTGTIAQTGGIGTAFAITSSHTYAEEGSYTVKVSISDVGGSTASATSAAPVSDPAVLATGGFTVSGTEAVDTGSQTLAVFKDPAGAESLSNYSATVAWGDGSASAGTVSFDSGTQVFTVSGDHTYAEQGTPTIAVTLHHDSAADATVTSSALVRIRSDITGRWVQGGSWWTGVSTGSSFITSSWANWSPKVHWVDVVTGDFNGDGRTDIAARDPGTGVWWVGLSNGSAFATTSWTMWSTKVTWVDVQVGDFNGDGKADIIGRVLETGQWWLAQSTGSSFTNSLWATWSAAATWVDVKVADFNGDGKADITGRWLEGGSWWTGVSTGSSFNTSQWAMWSPKVTWVDVKVGDFNGDGKMDIIGRWLEAGSWWVGVSTGSSFTTSQWAMWSPNATWVDVHVGDFNGDGKADIAGRWLEGGSWWTAISTGSSFNTSQWGSWATAATWVDVQVGDFNGDGKTDITGRWLEGGSWWTGLSTGSSFTTTQWAAWSTAATWADVRTGDYA